jgi:hypothetical protein
LLTNIQDELDRVHWEIVKGRRAIRVRQINNIVRNVLEVGGKRAVLPTISDETVYDPIYQGDQKEDEKSNPTIHVLDLGEKEHLRKLRQQEAELLRKATPARKKTYRHFTMVCLGIDAEEFDNIHADALLELNRAALWAKARRNQDGYTATRSALLQIRSIQKRVVEEWQTAMRDEVDRSAANLQKEWKRRKRRMLETTGDMKATKEIKSSEVSKTRRWLCFLSRS